MAKCKGHGHVLQLVMCGREAVDEIATILVTRVAVASSRIEMSRLNRGRDMDIRLAYQGKIWIKYNLDKCVKEWSLSKCFVYAT